MSIKLDHAIQSLVIKELQEEDIPRRKKVKANGRTKSTGPHQVKCTWGQPPLCQKHLAIDRFRDRKTAVRVEVSKKPDSTF